MPSCQCYLPGRKAVLLCRLATAEAEAEAGQAAARRKRAGGGDRGGGGGGQATRVVRLEENADLKRENAVTSGPNTPSGALSLANMLRRRFPAIMGLAHRGGAKKGRKRGG